MSALKRKIQYSRPCRSNRIVFSNLPCLALTGLKDKLTELHEQKQLCYALICDCEENLQGIIHLSLSFLAARDGGIRKWRDLLPPLSQGKIEDAGRQSDEDYKYCILERDITILEEFGEHESISEQTPRQKHVKDILSSRDMDEAMEKDADYCVRNFNALKTIFSNKMWKQNQGIIVEQLNCWQKIVMDKLMSQDNRTILFVIDTNGNRGKTFLGLYLRQMFGDKHLTITSSMKERDAAHVLAQAPNLESVTFDYSRQVTPEGFAWGLFETLKNGVVTTGKYQSQTIYFKNFVKVAVFTNHDPSYGFHKLSKDRVEVVNLDNLYAMNGEAMSALINEEEEEKN